MPKNTPPSSPQATAQLDCYDISQANQFRHDNQPAHDGYALLAVDERQRPLTCVVLAPANAAIKERGRYSEIVNLYQEMVVMRSHEAVVEATQYLFTLGGTKKVFIGIRTAEERRVLFDAFLEVIEVDPNHAQVVLTKMDWRQDWVLIQTVLYHNGTKLGFQSTGHEVEADNMALTIWREVQEELGNSPIDYAMTYYLNKRQAARLFSELNSLETYEEKQQWMRSQKAP